MGRQDHELGIALSRISQPSDLVVTVAHLIGDVVPNYYSGRRGWAFRADPCADESAAIQLFDQVRFQGAQWFGIVAEQRTKFGDCAPAFLSHIESTTELVDENRDWAIYRVLQTQK